MLGITSMNGMSGPSFTQSPLISQSGNCGGALLYGGRLVVVPYIVSRDPQAFYQLFVPRAGDRA